MPGQQWHGCVGLHSSAIRRRQAPAAAQKQARFAHAEHPLHGRDSAPFAVCTRFRFGPSIRLETERVPLLPPTALCDPVPSVRRMVA
jgi:hypothetical protein